VAGRGLVTSFVSEVRSLILEGRPCDIMGCGTKGGLRQPGATEIPITDYAGILNFSPADQLLTVRAGTRLADLLPEIEAHGQTLPLARFGEGFEYLGGLPGTVGGTIATGLPHFLEARFGHWTDWLLGARILTGDGLDAKSGSQAVKSVAGFDIYKMLVGSRGTLGLILEVHLRTYPLEAFRPPTPNAVPCSGPFGVQRVAAEDFSRQFAAYGDRLLAAEEESKTVWFKGEPLPAPSGWVHHSGVRQGGSSPLVEKYLARARETFNPGALLNRAECEGIR
jgi:glycolate oxidase FAD binding subunit